MSKPRETYQEGDVVVVNCAAGGKQIAMVSHWIDDDRFRAWKFRAASRRWSVLKTLHAGWIVGPIETEARKGRMLKALIDARKVGFPEDSQR